MSEDGGGKKYKNKMLPLAAGCIAGGIEATAVWPVSEFSFLFLRMLKSLCWIQRILAKQSLYKSSKRNYYSHL